MWTKKNLKKCVKQHTNLNKLIDLMQTDADQTRRDKKIAGYYKKVIRYSRKTNRDDNRGVAISEYKYLFLPISN